MFRIVLGCAYIIVLIMLMHEIYSSGFRGQRPSKIVNFIAVTCDHMHGKEIARVGLLVLQSKSHAIKLCIVALAMYVYKIYKEIAIF